MPANYIIGKTVISLKNVIFDYKAFYKVLYKTLSDKGYFIEEKKYSQTPADKKKSVDFYWKCQKELDDYNLNRVEVDAKFPDLEDIEVIKNAQKAIVQRGDVSITLRATLITDYDSKWEEQPLLNFFRVIFENIFKRSNINTFLDNLKSEMYEIENEIKSYFNIERIM